MKHETKIITEGEGITESAQVVCSCGWKSPKVYAYSSHYWTNQAMYKNNHLKESAMIDKLII